MRPTAISAVQVLLGYLAGEGVQYIFGIPGGPLMPLYEGIFDQRRIQPVITKHEEGAAFMAEGYARISGRLGVCCTTTGPGATNALTGVACAYIDSTPVLVITAQIALGAFGKGAAQESSVHGVDVVELYKLITKASVMLPAAEKMPEMVRMLLRKALTGRPGPVHLNLPADLMRKQLSVEHLQPRQYRTGEDYFDRDALRHACELLLQAKRPAILAGHGIFLSHAWRELRQFAERLCIPVATTPKAKGIMPEDHALSLGVFGLAGSPRSEAYLLGGEVDVLMAIGTSFAEASTHCWTEKLRPRHALIQVDIDPTEIGKNYPVDAAVCGDAKTVLTEMLYQAERELRWRRGPDLAARQASVKAVKDRHPFCVRPEGFDDLSVPLKPQRLMYELEEAMPPEAILFVDIGNVMAWALHYLRINRPGSFHINMGFGSMGHAVAACIGGKLAAPDRPVIALVGDAAFAMNGMEVHTAVENEVPVIWVVMNNSGHGMVCHGERIQFKGKFSTGKFRYPLDVAGLARAMGAQGLRVEKPGEFGPALEEALHSDRPTVIDAIVDPAESPPMALRIETLEKFFNADMAEEPEPPLEPEIVIRRSLETPARLPAYSRKGGNGSQGNHGSSVTVAGPTTNEVSSGATGTPATPMAPVTSSKPAVPGVSGVPGAPGAVGAPGAPTASAEAHDET